MELTAKKVDEVSLKIQRILSEYFNGSKSEIRSYKGRLNFACPYCGDSGNSSSKKRGNLYLESLAFHCFNCSKHSNLVGFLKDHNQSISNTDDLIFYLDYIRQNQISVPSKEYMELSVFENLKEYSISLADVKSKFNLFSVKENTRIEKYLKSRFLHYNLDHFMFDTKEEQLYIFNLSLDKQRTFGWQIRNFKNNREKYISYNIEKINYLIHGKIIEDEDEEIIRMNTLSLYFNIATVDFTKPVTVFEGPIDSLLCKNSIAICGVDKPVDMFNEIPTVRYLFDNDLPGRKKMEYLLKKRKTVFMWNKLIRDYKIHDKIKDFNDLLKYCWEKKIDAIKNYDKYFTNNPLDIRNV